MTLVEADTALLNAEKLFYERFQALHNDKTLLAVFKKFGIAAFPRVCEESGAPWMLENPVSTLSTYWRQPDHKFHPKHFTGHEPSDNYTKLTCLWTGGGFAMPSKYENDSLGEPDDRIHKAPPSAERGDFRSETPRGFARAVFLANQQKAASAN